MNTDKCTNVNKNSIRNMSRQARIEDTRIKSRHAFAEQRFCKSLLVLLRNESFHRILLYKVEIYSIQTTRKEMLLPAFHNEHAEDGMGDWNNQELNLRGRTKPSVKGHKIKEG